MNKKLVKEVKKRYKTQFNTKPEMVFSPGRINLIGEYTDFNEGFVFPGAINKGIVLAIHKSHTDTCQVHALNKDETYKFDLAAIEPLQNGGWRNYILGVVAEAQKRGHNIDNFNAVFAGDIPGGAGLSSSAALENSFIFGLNELFNLKLSKTEMILISQKAEHNYAGVKCGIMDQYASMFGVKKSALLLDCRTITSEPFQINLGKYKLLLINTNVKHDLSESAYNDRRAVCEDVSNKLNIEALRDASKEALNSIKKDITDEDFQKALYVIEENERVKLFSEAIQQDDLETLGKLIYQSHHGLSSQFKVSCEELDFLVDATKDNPNILGARMMGGGFGGCTINLILEDEVKKFKKEVSKKYLEKYGKACSIYSVKLSRGTKVIKK
ncbi:MAG: galactokinase [Kordia sp.]|uniref:galactokinase n=1 Tax=Kordia sp. TaxID=1965332 RepID=UPI00385A2AC4